MPVKKKAAPAKKPAPKKIVVKKAVAKKVVAKKVAPKKATPAKKAVKTPVVKATSKKATLVKAAPKKAPAKSAVAKKALAKKVGPAKAVVAKKEVPKKVTAKSVKPVAAKPKPPKIKEVKAMPELMLEAALQVLDERKALDVLSIDLRGRSPLADYAIVATGGSARQLGALAEYLREAFFKIGAKKLRIEGLPQGDWVLVDAGDVLIHLFRPEVRSFYQIEDIWSAKSPLGR